MVIDVKPATTLTEAACQMENAIDLCEDHYVRVCDTVLFNWSAMCKSVDIDALIKLADELEQETGSVCGMCMGKTARRIREALGVSDG